MPFAIAAVIPGPIRFSSEMPDLEFNAVDNVGPVEWSVNFGAMYPAVGNMSILNPLNLTHTVRHGGPVIITGKDTGTDPWEEVQIIVEVESTLPTGTEWQVESTVTENIELSIPDKGEPRFRDLDSVIASWPLVFILRDFSELAGIRHFLHYHGMTKPFWVEDIALGEVARGFRDSGWARSGNDANNLNYSFRFKCYNYVPPEGDADVGPFSEPPSAPD